MYVGSAETELPSLADESTSISSAETPLTVSIKIMQINSEADSFLILITPQPINENLNNDTGLQLGSRVKFI